MLLDPVPGSAELVLCCAAPASLDCSLPALRMCLLLLLGTFACTVTAMLCVLQQRPIAPARPIPSQLWCNNFAEPNENALGGNN